MNRAIVVLLALLTSTGAACLRSGFARPEQTPRPDAAVVLMDPISLSQNRTRSRMVSVQIDSRGVDRFLLTEEKEVPTISSPWRTTAPKRFQLSPGTGLKRVRLWLRGPADDIQSRPEVAVIYFDPGIVRVGLTSASCIDATSNRCHVSADEAGNVLQRAVNQAEPGDRIWLYGALDGTQAVYRGNMQIDKALTLEPARGHEKSAIVLLGLPSVRGLIQLTADGVVLSGLHLQVAQGGSCAITAVLSDHHNTFTDGWSGGHTIEGMRIEAISPAYGGSNSIEYAIFPGDDSMVRNNFVDGWWESVRLSGTSSRSVTGTTFTHNTVVMVESGPAVNMDYATTVSVRNNILATLNPTSSYAIRQATASETPTGNTVVANIVQGFARVGSTHLITDGNALIDSGMHHMRDPRPGFGSAALDAGLPDDDAGEFDYYGNSRLVGEARDVGAVEVQAERGGGAQRQVLPLTVNVGGQADGCPLDTAGTCDVYPESGASDPLRAAVSFARPGSVIQLHALADPEVNYDATDLVIDRPLTLRAAPGTTVGQVTLRNLGSTNWAMINVLYADGVTIETLKFICRRCTRAIYFDKGALTQNYAPLNGVVQNSIFVAETFTDNQTAVWLSHGGQLRNSLVYGQFEGFVTARGTSASVVGNTLVGTTLVTGSTQEVGDAFIIGGAVAFQAYNNLIDYTEAGDFAHRILVRNTGTKKPVFESNQFYGLGAFAGEVKTGADVPPGSNCITGPRLVETPAPSALCAGPQPLFSDRATNNYRLMRTSPAFSAADLSYVSAADRDLDALTRLRPGGGVNVGAYDTAGP